MTATTTTRPTTCSAMAAIDATLGEKGCRRLPRHKGEHRPFRTAKQVRQAAAAKPTASPKGKAKTGKMLAAARIALVSQLRSNAGAVGRKRLNAAQRRAAMAELAGMVASHKLSANDALGVAARLV